MRVGVTVRFQNSYFSGTLPQLGLSIGKAIQAAGHEVTYLHPPGDPTWFIDVPSTRPTNIRAFSEEQRYDLVVEVVWSLKAEDRAAQPRVVLLAPYPATFYDMESSVYQWNPTVRNFQNLKAIWTFDHFEKQDVRYLEFLSGKPVYTIPYVWDSAPLDAFVMEGNVPSWSNTATAIDERHPPELPQPLSWCARVVESNFSNSSHCTIPLCVVSEIRKAGDPVRLTVHNGEATAKHEFFKANIARNLAVPDISGAMVPRVRLPDLLRDKSVLVAHQRFRPLKSFLLDAMYLGIPMIHNCALVKSLGAPYYYELNQISQALTAWQQLKADYAGKKGFFNSSTATIRKHVLNQRFGPVGKQDAYKAVVERTVAATVTVTTATATATATATGDSVKPKKLLPFSLPDAMQNVVTYVGKQQEQQEQQQNQSQQNQQNQSTLRVAFCKMWDNFQPSYNFFTLLLGWASGKRVVVDEEKPHVVFYGPFSGTEVDKYAEVPKVYFTGEGGAAVARGKAPNTFLHLGFDYTTDADFIRLPLWQLEINWFGADPNKLANPKPIPLADCLRVNPEVLKRKTKFCAFVATNAMNPQRNEAFHALSSYKHVDAGGRLFCNRPGGPIPAGLGGGGGELAKVDFYKDYAFAITYENQSAPGYTTEKLFHAKVAGCIPLYWGDAYVDRDFDSRGFLNLNQCKSREDFLARIKAVEADPIKREAMAAVPAVSEFKRLQIQRTMEEIAKRIIRRATGESIVPPSWETAESYALPSSAPLPPSPPSEVSTSNHQKRVIVTAANAKYAEAAVNAIHSARSAHPEAEIHVYVWPDVPAPILSVFEQQGATTLWTFPVTDEVPYPSFWDPQHFAWKLWLFQHAAKIQPPGTSVMYADAGIVFASPVDALFEQVEKSDVLLLEDDEQTQERWCHPTFRSHFAMTDAEAKAQQLIGGFVGFKVGGKYAAVFAKALLVAQTKPDVIQGEKWHRYTETCMGHRHDQSILSLLTRRAGAPRLPLRDYYCDTSMRDARQYGLPLYVHRGHYKEFNVFSDGIGEAYVINLAKRKDRLAAFKANHPAFKNKVLVSPAVDGRTLPLTDALRHCFRNNDFKWKKSVMGCALSHLTLWEKLANDKQLTSYLIMEDDVKFQSDWQAQWLTAAAAIPTDADVIYLGGVLPPNKPAFPHIVEPVNAHFAKVKANTLFSPPGAPPRRYFHFCNYAYVLTKAGARKLVALVKERGIFTSGDHMIVNHGDSSVVAADKALNIYFTTPLLATCTQEEDPVYVKAQFNDFSRLDTYDSDLWNNNDHFSEAEVGGLTDDLLQQLDKKPNTQPVAEATVATVATAAAAATAAAVPVDSNALWNTFLQQVAAKQTDRVSETLDRIITYWKTLSAEEFVRHQFSWFRVLEQLIVSRNDVLVPLHKQIAASIKTMSIQLPFFNALYSAVDPPLNARPGIPHYDLPRDAYVLYHGESMNPVHLQEAEWLEECVGKPIVFRHYKDAINGTNPTVLFSRDRSNADKEAQSIRERDEVLTLLSGRPFTLLHLSDEFANEDIGFYSRCPRVLRNYWRRGLPPCATVVPLGYARSRHGRNYPTSPSFTERPHIWSFAGSLDREGRASALAVLRSVSPHREETKATWDTAAALDARAYNDLLRTTKFVPCFRGARSLESYRMYEALEQGAIPIYVPGESSGCEDEWRELLGSHPFLGFPSWAKAAELLPMLARETDAMERHRAVCAEWWAKKKATVRALFA